MSIHRWLVYCGPKLVVVDENAEREGGSCCDVAVHMLCLH